VTAHARLSASSAHRWARCPYSITAEKDIPNTSSAASIEGTCAHELAEICLPEKLDPRDYIGTEVANHVVDSDMADHIQGYIDYIYSHGVGSSARFYELRVCYAHVVPDGFGTCDCVVISGDTLHIIDLKYGIGEHVEARENYQLLLYAIGAMQYFSWINFSYIKMHIYQPRKNNVDSWTQAASDFVLWREFFSTRAMETYSDDAPALPSPKGCHWCRARGECVELAKYVEQRVKFKDAIEKDRKTDLEYSEAVFKDKKVIESFLKANEERLKNALEMGIKFEDVKLVKRRAVRRFEDDDLLKEALENQIGDKAYKKELISVSKAEKIIGKNRFKELGFSSFVVYPDIGTAVALSNDKRKEVKINIINGSFEEIKQNV